jgi:hypothetical protein
MANDGDQIALTSRLHSQHREAVLLVVEGGVFDEASEVLAFRLGRRRPHRGPTFAL